MKIALATVMVDDQDKALRFYTEGLGFKRMADLPFPGYRWLTVVSPEVPDSIELVLEPTSTEAARTFQKALYDAATPMVAFLSSDIHTEYARLKERGVVFRGEPTIEGPITTVLFEDGCGNLIHLFQPNQPRP